MNKKKPQVLLLGNGLNRAFDGVSWNELMRLIADNTKIPSGHELQSPMPLQAVIVTNNHLRSTMKEHHKAFYGKIEEDEHRELLYRILTMGFDHILTTNYSYELEAAATGASMASDRALKKMQTHTGANGMKSAESKYMLHTYNEAVVDGVVNRIWHIHGEARKPDSMVLGHYYYGSLLHRYKLLFDKRQNAYRNAELAGEEYNITSWLDAFVLGDLYVLGFGYDLSEFDLWWLLNRKQREKAQGKGTLHFYEATKATAFDEKIALLEAFDAEHHDLGFIASEERFKDFYRSALDDIEAKMHMQL